MRRRNRPAARPARRTVFQFLEARSRIFSKAWKICALRLPRVGKLGPKSFQTLEVAARRGGRAGGNVIASARFKEASA